MQETGASKRSSKADGINSFSKLERKNWGKKGSAPASAWNWLGCPSSLPFIGHVLIDACLSDRRTVGGPNRCSLEPNPCHSSNEKGASERERYLRNGRKRGPGQRARPIPARSTRIGHQRPEKTTTCVRAFDRGRPVF